MLAFEMQYLVGTHRHLTYWLVLLHVAPRPVCIASGGNSTVKAITTAQASARLGKWL
jgi:hypothetical protein